MQSKKKRKKERKRNWAYSAYHLQEKSDNFRSVGEYSQMKCSRSLVVWLVHKVCAMLYQVLHGAGQTGTEKINSGMGKPGPQAKFHTTVYIYVIILIVH